jgi:ZIP family zinc transporter
MILVQALSYTALAVVAALVGGVIAVYHPPAPNGEQRPFLAIFLLDMLH